MCIVSTTHIKHHFIQRNSASLGSVILRGPGTSPLDIWRSDCNVYISYNRLGLRPLLVVLPTNVPFQQVYITKPVFVFLNMHFLDQVLTTWLLQSHNTSQNYDVVTSFHS